MAATVGWVINNHRTTAFPLAGCQLVVALLTIVPSLTLLCAKVTLETLSGHKHPGRINIKEKKIERKRVSGWVVVTTPSNLLNKRKIENCMVPKKLPQKKHFCGRSSPSSTPILLDGSSGRNGPLSCSRKMKLLEAAN